MQQAAENRIVRAMTQSQTTRSTGMPAKIKSSVPWIAAFMTAPISTPTASVVTSLCEYNTKRSANVVDFAAGLLFFFFFLLDAGMMGQLGWLALAHAHKNTGHSLVFNINNGPPVSG